MANELKQTGDKAFEAGEYRNAIRAYSDPRATSNEVPLETRRTILANRSQAYYRYGDIYNALADCDLALSAKYTIPTSPIKLTSKCHFRRARILYKMTRYEEARLDCKPYESLPEKTLAPDIKQLMIDIDRALLLEEGSAEMEKIKLIRAVQDRGIIIQDMYRSNFPYHPSGNDEQYEPLSFADDAETTWLAVPFNLKFPYFQHYSGSRRFSGRCKWSEWHPGLGCLTVGSFVESMLQGSAMQAPNNPLGKKWILDSVKYASPKESTLIMVTHGGRLPAIPHETRVTDLWTGVKWPNEEGLAFKDLRRIPRTRPHEIDGFSLNLGYDVDMYVVLNEDVNKFVDTIEEGSLAIDE